jgi:hypothetical protein
MPYSENGAGIIERLFRLPEHVKDDLKNIARIIYSTSTGFILLSLTFITVIPFIAPTVIQRAQILAGTVCFASLIIIALVRYDRLRVASALLIGVRNCSRVRSKREISGWMWEAICQPSAETVSDCPKSCKT